MTSGDLELLNVGVAALTPLSVALVGFVLDRRMSLVEQGNWVNQKLVEGRLRLFEVLSPLLNDLYCYFAWVGHWKKITPGDAMSAKRELDRQVHIGRYLLPDGCYEAYQAYVNLLFQTFTGPGQDALMRTEVAGDDGDRRRDATYAWNPQWDSAFCVKEDVASGDEVRAAYRGVMEAFAKSLGAKASKLTGRQ